MQTLQGILPSRLLRSQTAKPAGQNGDDRVRTGDPLLAKQVLSQLSYAPKTQRGNSPDSKNSHPQMTQISADEDKITQMPALKPQLAPFHPQATEPLICAICVICG